MTPEQKHNIRQALGIGACTWEIVALALDRPDLLPRITDIGRMHPAIGGGISAWVLGHLLQPSLTAAKVRLQARLHAARG